jgi:hypothetical protein
LALALAAASGVGAGAGVEDVEPLEEDELLFWAETGSTKQIATKKAAEDRKGI